ncbi:uncharacterized protein DS421_13g404140 [Arachis hypogaea]|nr:uncharacterized protein DS421_13g404140 [Arachis hypogaea]
MKSKSTKILEELFDRAAEKENVRNHLCFLELQLVEVKRKESYVTINFYQTKITLTCRRGGYEHFYRIKFFY